MHVVKNYSFAHFSCQLHLLVNHLYICIVPDKETSVRRASTWPYSTVYEICGVESCVPPLSTQATSSPVY